MKNMEKTFRLPAPGGLRVNGLNAPLGIDDPVRRLSWELPWTGPGAAPSAVRVVLASTPGALEAGPWLEDTGRVAAADAEGGIAMLDEAPRRSRERVWWRVMAWDEAGGASAWSDPSFYEMGLLAADDWESPWLAAPGVPLPLLRCAFPLEGGVEAIARARVYVSGLGYYHARLNGQPLGDAARAPDYTDYWKRVFYATHAVESHLVAGENVIGIVLGQGWFERFGYGDSMARCRVEIDYRDGRRQVEGADLRTWRAAPGPWRAADPYRGETYDARLERPGWDRPGYGGVEDWGPVSAAHRAPDAAMRGAACEPVRVTETLAPASVREVRPGVRVVDFGRNFTGWLRLTAEGAAGTQVRLRCAELCAEDGSLLQASLRGAECTDRYVLKGGGVEAWEPSFTHRGFRYVQVEGSPALPDAWSVEGRVAHTDMPRRGRFACSDERLNRLHRAVDWTIRANTMSVTTDCPQRDERQGWLGDGHLVAETVLHHFDPTGFYHKWLQDIRETQDEAGRRWSTCAPPWYSRGRDRPPHRGRRQADLAWTAAGTLIPWEVYLHHGDRSVLREAAPAVLAHVRYLAGRGDFPRIDAVEIGDHLFPGWGEKKDPTDPVLLGTAFALEQTRIAGRMAALLDDPAAARECEAWAEAYRRALAENFHDPATGGFGSQTADALALQFAFTPARDRTLAHLVADIERRGGHLATGIVGTRYLLEALSANGRSDVAWRVVTAEGYPGWMDMLANGATTITERWTYWDHWEMNSHNHPAFGSVGAWLFRWLAGIRVDPEAPGYRRFTVAPHLPEGMAWSEAELDTVRGRVAVRWERRDGCIRMDVTVPPGAEAAVRLPALSGEVERRLLGPVTHTLESQDAGLRDERTRRTGCAFTASTREATRGE